MDAIAARDGNNLLSTTKVALDSHAQLDANLIWTPTPKLELMLAGQNLLNSSQVEYVMEYIIPPPGIERSVYGEITWRF